MKLVWPLLSARVNLSRCNLGHEYSLSAACQEAVTCLQGLPVVMTSCHQLCSSARGNLRRLRSLRQRSVREVREIGGVEDSESASRTSFKWCFVDVDEDAIGR